MTTRHIGLWVTLFVLTPTTTISAASVRTQNFIVEAPSSELAQEFGRLAEGYRKSKAVEWLGREMPNWPSPCPLRVSVQDTGAGGATSFNFTNGQVSQTMHIEGAVDRLRHSVLPHEVTHTVFAHHFRQPVPRWADEGGSVLSEDNLERQRHDTMCRQLLNAGRGMQLRVLFNLKDYPKDVMVLYAQGFSVTRFLVDQGGRANFLNFIAAGMRNGWDAAVQQFYSFESLQELEKAWLDSLRKIAQPVARVDQQSQDNPNTELTNRVVVKEFYQPNLVNLDPPIVARGASPDGWNQPPVRFADPQPQQPAPKPKPLVQLSEPRPQQPTRSNGPPIVLFPPEPFPSR